jgi:hypothetical protein
MSSVRDILVICIILFAVGISLMFIVKIGHNVNTQLLNVPTFNNSISAKTVISNTDNAINSTDYIYLALFISLFIGVIMFGYMIGGTPILAPIYFFILIIFGFIGVILQMVWADIGAGSNLIATTVAMPITNYILLHLGYYAVVMGLAGILAMFMKSPEQTSY